MSDGVKENSETSEKVDTNPKAPKIGCSHYARKCILISPCCSKKYTCRICHDETEDHELNRRMVQKVECAKCQLVQKVQRACEKCETVFGQYFCEKCRLYDDEDKGQFHCDGCGLCRIGGKDKFYHCDKCGICLAVSLQGNHRCVEESSRRNCAVCLDDLHTSRIDAHIPPCGHLIHSSCMKQCIKTGCLHHETKPLNQETKVTGTYTHYRISHGVGMHYYLKNYACPTCGQSLFDMKSVWTQLDQEVENTPMPEEYKEFYVYVLCKDCHKESKVKFHVIGLKCQKCGSYNTCRTSAPEGEPEPKPPDVPAPNGPRSESDEPHEGATGGASR